MRTPLSNGASWHGECTLCAREYALEQAQPDGDTRIETARRTLEECDRKLARHRAALESGSRPGAHRDLEPGGAGPSTATQAKPAQLQS